MKSLLKHGKSLKYLVWIGPFLIVMGLSAGVVAGSFGAVPLGLIIAGIVAIALWVILQGNSDVTSPGHQFWGRRSTLAGTNAFVATLAVLMILGLVNLVAARNAARVDLTENQIFTLSPQSQQLVRNLTQPVKVWVFSQTPNPQDSELLENYRRQSPNFRFEFVDPNARVDLAQKFKVTDPGSVYVEYGQRQKFVQTVSDGERLSEVKLTNGLQQVKSDRIDKVYFLQGHGELPLQAGQEALSVAVQSLEDKNYKSEPLNLAERTQVPTDASVVVVADPKQGLFEAEVTALKDYLRRGGSVLLMVNPNTNPGLDNLLQEWGVKLDNRLVINASNQQVRGFGPRAALVTQYGDHPITKDFSNRYSFYPFARAIEIIPTSDVNATPLLLTNEQTWAESNPENQELKFDPSQDRQGPLTLGVALSRKVDSWPSSPPTSPDLKQPVAPGTPSPSPSPSPTKTETSSEKPKTESRLVVLGNSTFATDTLFGQQLNGDVFLNSVSWLSQRDDQTLSIRPKQASNRRINLTPPLVRTLLLIVLLVPLAGFSIGGLIWWKRR
jgi:ABC-type uncharacterized transport system involved in gliding motility auxiliary subunit